MKLYKKDTSSIDETPARDIAAMVITLLNHEGYLTDKQVEGDSYYFLEDLLTEKINNRVREWERT